MGQQQPWWTFPTPTDALLVLDYIQDDPDYEGRADLQAARRLWLHWQETWILLSTEGAGRMGNWT